ncbi:MAG: hypothetical protein ACAH11_10615, partial [Sphingomonas sp.]
GAAPDTPMDVRLQLQSYAAVPEMELPGMGVVVGGERIAPGQPRGNAVVEPRWLGPLAEPAFLCAKSETHFTWPASVDASEARLKLVSRKVYLPWYTCIFALFCIVAMQGICGPGWRAPGAERIAVPLLQWLLSLRLLIGVAGLYNDTALTARDVLSDGMSSLLCLPVLAVVALRPGGREVRTLMVSLELLVVAMIALRLALAGIGYVTGMGLTERVFGLPLSMIYVPAVPLGFALLLDGLRPLPRERRDLWIVFALFIAAYWAVPAATRDFGLIFVSGWPLAMVIGWFGARHLATPGGRLSRTGWWIAPALPVLFIAGWGVYIALFSSIASPTTALGTHIAEVVGWSRNDVRMLAFLAPDRVEALGTKFAFESLDLITSLQPLTQDLTGQGYLTQSNVKRSLLDNQFSDNLSAVHIIWQWGRAGAVALLLVIFVGIRSFRAPAAPGAGDSPPDWRALAGIMAGVTFAWAAIYMVMANLNWVPFTGRNIYLLAATSGGDLVEGLLLLLMMALPLAIVPPKAEAR